MTDMEYIATSVPQEQETLVTLVQRQAFRYRYAYARSADSRAAEDNGQDFLTIRENANRLAFALCDGVGQSFMGDLGARILGQAMVDWFWAIPSGNITADNVQADVKALLHTLTTPASEQIQALVLPETLPDMVREVLEKKRSLGSESMFAAGVIDMPASQLTCAWMGDMRIRLWGKHQERTAELGNHFDTAERWSSRRGTVGDVHAFVTPLATIDRFVVYSDGLAQLDTGMSDSPDNASLDATIEQAGMMPASDDISFFELWTIKG